MGYWKLYGFQTATQFWVVIIGGVVIGLTVCFAVDATINRRRGNYSGWDFLDFLSIIGSIFKLLGRGLIFLIALFRREAPPTFSGRSSKQEENLDEFEDDEDRPRKQRKIDEYHV